VSVETAASPQPVPPAKLETSQWSLTAIKLQVQSIKDVSVGSRTVTGVQLVGRPDMMDRFFHILPQASSNHLPIAAKKPRLEAEDRELVSKRH
jgi:hypothetical protein